MSQDEQREQQQGSATGGAAATMPEPDFHPFAEEAAQLAQQTQPQGEGQEQGASAPVPPSAPEHQQQAEPPQPPQESEDYQTKYEELQQQLEAERQQREQHEQLIEQQQRAWMEHQQRLNEAQSAEARKNAEKTYREQLKAAYDQAVSADDDEAGLKALDQFVRDGVAKRLATEYQRRLEETQQQHQQEMAQFKSEAEQALTDHYKPGFARELVQKHGLPESAVGYLMTATDVNAMPQMAENAKNLLAQAAPHLQQQAIQQQVQQRRDDGTFAPSGAGGGPLPDKELEPMAAGSPQATAIARELLTSIMG